jgi:hypothetical protein
VTYVIYYIIFIFWQLAPTDGVTSMTGHAVIGYYATGDGG